MEKVKGNCQSCSMPLNKDAKGGGSEADGSKSKKFCSLCYANGKFLQPDITAAEMQDIVKGKDDGNGISRFYGQALREEDSTLGALAVVLLNIPLNHLGGDTPGFSPPKDYLFAVSQHLESFSNAKSKLCSLALSSITMSWVKPLQLAPTSSVKRP